MILSNKTAMAFAAVFAAAFWLAELSLFNQAAAATTTARNCTMDPIKQSVCIYEAILADVDKNYPMRGGGGISRIVQNSTTSYSVHILQEGHEDVRTYEIKILSGGKVAITSVAEKTLSH